VAHTPVALGTSQGTEQDGVIRGGGGGPAPGGDEDAGRAARVERDQALVRAFRRVERGLVAEQDAERAEAGHVPPEDGEAEGHRDREQEARDPPQPRPEHGAQDDRQRGQAGAVPVDEGSTTFPTMMSMPRIVPKTAIVRPSRRTPRWTPRWGGGPDPRADVRG
jgi:hypothetical protein